MKLMRVFLNTSMVYSHSGLLALLMEAKIPLPIEGEFVCFVNKARDRLKVLTHNNILAYMVLPKGTKFSLDVIQFIPAAFEGGELEYNNVLKEAVIKALEKKGRGIWISK